MERIVAPFQVEGEEVLRAFGDGVEQAVDETCLRNLASEWNVSADKKRAI